MDSPSRVLAAVVAGASLGLLSGCSMNSVLWGPDAAGVIEVTEELIGAASTGEQQAVACENSATDFGHSQAWEGLSAGEPERFNAETSVDRPLLDAVWRINLEGATVGRTPDVASPTDVFYQETDDGLCVADIIWQTVDPG